MTGQSFNELSQYFGGERGPGLDSESESGVDSESERESCSQGLAGGGGKILDLPSTLLPVLLFGAEGNPSKRF